MPHILDFHIHSHSEGNFRIEIFDRNAAHPLASTVFDYAFTLGTEAEINSLGFDGKDPVSRVERLQAFGNRLYQKLFTPDVQHVCNEYKERSDFLTLCFRFAEDAAKLEALPWEALHDGNEFFVEDAKLCISRLPLEIQPQDDLPAVPLPLKMFALVSSPLDLPEQSRLQIEREQEILLEAINNPAGQGRLRADFEDEAKLEIIESSFDTPYHIFHYTGHGISASDGGGLLLEDTQGKHRAVSINEVRQVLKKGEGILRLAVLSGCQTARTLHTGGFRDLARTLARKIPAVIAMQFSVTDAGGLKFAEKFYEQIANNQSLEKAVSAARRALLLSDDYFLKADALAIVLITANGECLKTTKEQALSEVEMPAIDKSFYLPLAQHSFGFYGRRREYRQIRDGILQRNQRAVIIHGIGGIGKTSLVSYTSTRLRKKFRGVYAFDCSSGTLSPERVLLELLRYFNIQDKFPAQYLKFLADLLHQSLPPEMLANYLAEVLKHWAVLLIFDNFETHLERSETEFIIRDKDLRTFISNLVKGTATGSHFLFTSRYLFDVDARRLGNIQSVPLDDLSRVEALSLMQKLPRLSEATFEQKHKALQTFGGHPYALVTLDRYCNHQSLEHALANARPVTDELRAFLAIELNYDSLYALSRELLNRVAAFRQDVPIEAVEWVMGKKISYVAEFLQGMKQQGLPEEWQGMDDAAILETLEEGLPERRQAENLNPMISELIDWGLLTPIFADGQLQYLSVHNLVRDFCRDKQQGEIWRDRLRDAAAFFTTQTQLLGEYDKTPAAVWSEMEAFELLLEAEDYNDAAVLLGKTDPILDRWGFGRYLENQYHRLLNRLDKRGVAFALHNLGVIHQDRGEYDEALKKYQQSLEIKEYLGDREGVAGSLHEIGRLHQARGEYDEALKKYQQSLEIEEELGDRAGVATSLHQFGTLHLIRGEYDEALKKYQQSLEIEEELGDRAGVANSYGQIAMLHQVRSEYDEALKKYQQSLEISEELGDQKTVGISLHNLGVVHQARGEYDEALKKYQQSLEIKEDLGDRAGVANSLGQLGKLFIVLERFQEAFEFSLSALSTFIELQSPNAGIAANNLKNLRGKWGEVNFDVAWQAATGGDVPGWVKE
jgi:tetratricopeptide (TPR) repeat protein